MNGRVNGKSTRLTTSQTKTVEGYHVINSCSVIPVWRTNSSYDTFFRLYTTTHIIPDIRVYRYDVSEAFFFTQEYTYRVIQHARYQGKTGFPPTCKIPTENGVSTDTRFCCGGYGRNPDFGGYTRVGSGCLVLGGACRRLTTYPAVSLEG